MKIKKILPVIIIISLIACIVIARNIAEKRAAIPTNPSETVGNTAGNLYNGGLFCETSSGVYYSNPYDGGALYVLNADGSSKKIADGNISAINAAGNYLYYYTSEASSGAGLGYVRGGRGVYRIGIGKKSDTVLMPGTSDSVMLLGNDVYYTYFGDTAKDDSAIVTLRKVATDGSYDEEVFTEHIKLGAAYGSTIYYAGVTENHHLYALDTLTGSVRSVLSRNMYLPIVQGSDVYFLDLDEDYHLKKVNLGSGEETVIVAERIDTYNMAGGMIYYMNCNPDAYALKRVSMDGGNSEIVYEGIVKNIFCTESTTYFTLFGADVPIYQTPTTGAIAVTTFDSAMQAAMESVK